jgi:AcrR family transcriptional regulator
LGERALGIAATRGRIVEAALELYTERGISATTMREIGERADVAPGTLRKHFPTREALEVAMLASIEADAPLPEPAIFDGVGTIEGRLRRLLRVAATFFVQADRVYRMWLREPMLTEPWSSAGRRWGDRWELLMTLALGELAGDPEAAAVLRAVLQPTFFEGVESGRRPTAATADLVADVVTPWFSARARRARRPPDRPD